MIILGLLNLVKGLLSVLLIFNLPAMPDSVQSTLTTVATYLGDGISVLRAFIGADALNVCSVYLGLVVIIDSAYFLYSTVMWILQKIPMLGINK